MMMTTANGRFAEVKTRLVKVELPKELRKMVVTDRPVPLPAIPVVIEITEIRKAWAMQTTKAALAAIVSGDTETADRLARSILRFEYNPGIDLYGAWNDKFSRSKSWDERACHPWHFGDEREFEKIKTTIGHFVEPPSLDLASGRGEYYTPDVAVDGSRAMLLRNPAALRLLGDLDSISSGARLPFSEHFRTVTMLLGEKYLFDPLSVYGEARRVLKTNGQIFLVEGARGYPHLAKRVHDPAQTKAWLRDAGFSNVVCIDICDGSFQLFRGHNLH